MIFRLPSHQFSIQVIQILEWKNDARYKTVNERTDREWRVRLKSKVGEVKKGMREGEREHEVEGDVRVEEIMTLVFCFLSFLVLFLGILIVNPLRLLFFFFDESSYMCESWHIDNK